MFKKMSLALVAGAACLGIQVYEANAIEAGAGSEPAVIYANQPAQPPLPVRMAYAGRSHMGGGFIDFLFGERPTADRRYQQQPAYEQQPSYRQRGPLLPSMAPQQTTRQQEDASEPVDPSFNPKYEKQLVDYLGDESPGTIVVDTPNKGRYATA